LPATPEYPVVGDQDGAPWWRAIVVSALRTGVQYAISPEALAHGSRAAFGQAFGSDAFAVAPSSTDDQAGRCTGAKRERGKKYGRKFLSERHFHIDLSIVHDWTN